MAAEAKNTQASNPAPRLSRRQCLRILAAGGVAGLTAAGAWRANASLPAVTEVRLLMGTVVHLTVVGPQIREAQAAARACLARMAAYEGTLSRFLPQSDVTRLNQVGELAAASPELRDLLERARQISLASGGAFDISVAPLLALYRQAQVQGALPAAGAIETALARVDFRQIHVAGQRVWLGRPGMAITLDAIAKGYIIDAGVAELRRLGFPNTLVEAGGDLMGAGARGPSDAWKVAVLAPRPDRSTYQAELAVQNQAVATSGDYQQAFSPDMRHHHIVDPRTGYSSAELASATIVAPETWLADALATATMVLGPAAGLELVARFPASRGYLIGKDLQVYESPPSG